ncbi:unnamed protein product [Prorocentrum cordatum]|uniref:Mei2-like C-terminal RNA recognition motif domain-containing protein n=1 Tax=Prorocentrum cordatum TaxID=2364126 RepID=A0ABN9PSD9_9DINO|nr:unnamed protein product [Polarella glacialis]
MHWDDGVVTVMVRQIPRRFTQLMFLKEVNCSGFEGLFDFLYLPYDLKKGINVGYGFLNFITPHHAQEFRRAFDGSFLDKQIRCRAKPVRVHPASVQGYEANYRHFVQTKTGQKQDGPPVQSTLLPEGGRARGPRGCEQHASTPGSVVRRARSAPPPVPPDYFVTAPVGLTAEDGGRARPSRGSFGQTFQARAPRATSAARHTESTISARAAGSGSPLEPVAAEADTRIAELRGHQRGGDGEQYPVATHAPPARDAR